MRLKIISIPLLLLLIVGCFPLHLPEDAEDLLFLRYDPTFFTVVSFQEGNIPQELQNNIYEAWCVVVRLPGNEISTDVLFKSKLIPADIAFQNDNWWITLNHDNHGFFDLLGCSNYPD